MADVTNSQLNRAAVVNSMGAQSNCLWFLATTHTQAEAKAAGYFNNARSMLTPGDVIIATCVIGGTMKASHLRVATVPASGNVTTTAYFEET
jgi:hypothetical protein